MRFGIVAEGPADVAVLRNILKGKLGVDRSETRVLRPELYEDATDQAEYRDPAPEAFSNWLLVMDECRQRTRIEDFLQSQIEEDALVIVHLDTAEARCAGYDIERPDRRDPAYADLLRALVVQKIDGLLGPELAARVRHAIAIEETDAWVLTIHDKERKDTGSRLDPKKRLAFLLGKPKGSPYERYRELTRNFRDRKRLEACAKKNRSLRLFLDTLAPPATEP
jgi:hypothetical protein